MDVPVQGQQAIHVTGERGQSPLPSSLPLTPQQRIPFIEFRKRNCLSDAEEGRGVLQAVADLLASALS
jgi:hypothetical protein